VSATEKKLVQASFAGWKLDLIKALCSDRALQPGDVRVALALVQHLNIGSYKAFPNQDTLAEIACMTDRNVRICTDRMRKAGWLRWDRGNRQKSNEYEFDANKIADEVARMKRDEEGRRQQQKQKRSVGSDRNHSSSQNEVLTGSPVPLATGSPVPPNTYMEQGGPERDPVEDAA
jgi:hypothetical protein